MNIINSLVDSKAISTIAWSPVAAASVKTEKMFFQPDLMFEALAHTICCMHLTTKSWTECRLCVEEERRGHRERWTKKEKWSDINVNNILLKLEQSANYVCGEKMSGEGEN